jgi:hypothetical protein
MGERLEETGKRLLDCDFKGLYKDTAYASGIRLGGCNRPRGPGERTVRIRLVREERTV